MSRNVTLFRNLVQSYVYLLCLSLARNDSNSQTQSPMIAWREGDHQYQALDRFILREELACRCRGAQCGMQDCFVRKRCRQDFFGKTALQAKKICLICLSVVVCK